MTPSEFKSIFPAFESENNERLQVFIDRADAYFDMNRWGGFYLEGVANFVAHNLVTSNSQAAQGSAAVASSTDVASKSVGGVSVSRDGSLLNKQADNPFLRTAYGQQYLYLSKKVGFGAIAV